MRTLVLFACLASSVGCWYGKVFELYGKALGVGAGSAPAQQPAQPDEVAQEQAYAEPEPAYAEPPAYQPEPVRVEHRFIQSHVSTQQSYTHTVQSAPSYPSRPFIAMYPPHRGANERVCKVFTQSADNKNDCMVHCNYQVRFGPGSCSCMELDRCPQGARQVP